MKSMGLATIGRDVEVRFTPSGEAVANVSLATNYGKKDDQGNRPTQWIEGVLWGDRAKTLAPMLTKGSQHVFYLDEIHMETYQKNGGGEGVKLVARIIDVELTRRQQGGDQGSAPAQRPAAAPAARPAQKPAANFSDMDDDIPF
jgi:single-strand DNA-binding protein